MKDYTYIFKKDVEIPEIVIKKANEAFEKINMEENNKMISFEKLKNNEKKSGFWRKPAIAVACACILAVGGITAVATISHNWDRGINGILQADNQQQEMLIDNGMATVFSEKEDYSDMAVTVDGVTVAPSVVVVDNNFLYMSFLVSGFDVEEDRQPAFEATELYLESPDGEKAINLSGSASFHNGIILNENLDPIYEDGSPLEYDKNGATIEHYIDKNGNLEYHTSAYVPDLSGILPGKKLHVTLTNLGVYGEGKSLDVFTRVKGQWDFTIDLPNVESPRKIEVNKNVGDTGYILNSIEISPISFKADYTITNESASEMTVFLQGVVLDDGTRLPYIIGGGGIEGLTYSDTLGAMECHGFNRVIDVDKISAVLLREAGGTKQIEIPIK